MKLMVNHPAGIAMERAYPRAPLTVPVRYFEWNRVRDATAAEIGGNGMFLRTDSLLPEGTLITVRLALPGARRAFTVLARVVRVVRGGPGSQRSTGMGIAFVDLQSADRALVLDYVYARRRAAA